MLRGARAAGLTMDGQLAIRDRIVCESKGKFRDIVSRPVERPSVCAACKDRRNNDESVCLIEPLDSRAIGQDDDGLRNDLV